MKTIFTALFLCLAYGLVADNGTNATTDQTQMPSSAVPAVTMTKSMSYMMIDPKARANDFSQAFELLKREKTSNKIFFQLTDNSIINNVLEITVLDNGTMMLFRSNTSQGIKLQIVSVENVAAISYSP